MEWNHVSIGNCGEYFVAAELERRGFTVALPISNVKDFDLLAIHRSTLRKIAIQVKTTKGAAKKWLLSEKNEQLVDDDVFYVFVALAGLGAPEYHIVPSAAVAQHLKSEYEKWLCTPGKNGHRHRATAIRNFVDAEDVYLDNWAVLM